MDRIQSQVKEFMLAAGQACPNTPTCSDEQTRILRVRLLLEEVLELADASGVCLSVGMNYCPSTGLRDLGDFEIYHHDINQPNLVEMADALADINYVSYGAAVAYGLDMESLDQAVHDSNMTKFIDGHRDTNGKWIKGPSYTPVNLKPLVEAQYDNGTANSNSQAHSAEVQLEFNF